MIDRVTRHIKIPTWGWPCKLAFAYNSVIRGTWIPSLQVAAMLNCYIENTSPNLNDEIQYKFAHRAGAFTFVLLAGMGNATAIITIYIDGVSQGTIDLYNAVPTVWNNFLTLAINILTNGEHTLNIKATSKNGASTNYYVPLIAWWIRD
jgi:hypothetical protein